MRYNLRHGELPVFDKTHVKDGLLVKKTVVDNDGKKIGNEVFERPESGMLNPCNILQLVVDCLCLSLFFERILLLLIGQIY